MTILCVIISSKSVTINMNVTIFKDAYLNRVSTIIQSEDFNLHVVNALRFVIRNIFTNFTNAFVLTVSSSGGPVEFWLHDAMSKLFATWGLIAVQLIVMNSKIQRIEISGKRYCNMIMIDNLESLKRTNIVEYNRNSDNLEYYFIFLQIRDNLMDIEMAKIFKYCFDNYWIHCNVMVQNSKGDVLVYTYFPFNEGECFETKPELINRFIFNSFENHIMFPNKLRNLHKCSLKISTWETPPFVVNAINTRSPHVNVSGFEILTLITISEHMNFTMNIEWLEIETYNKNISPETQPLLRVSIEIRKYFTI